MNHDLEQLIAKSAPTETLSTHERAAMRAALSEYLSYRPHRAPESAAPAWQQAFRVLVQGRAPVFLSAFLVIALTTGSVASAAEGALPGDPLYSLKVDLLEPLRLSLASSHERTAWQRSFAERRLTEAAQLAEQGRLTPDTEAELALTFAHYADLVIETPAPVAAKVAVEAAPEADAGAARTMTMSLSAPAPEPAPLPPADRETEDFSARLAAYESILMHIDNARKSTTTEALRRAIHAQTDKVPEGADDETRARKAAARLEVFTEVTETLETDLPTELSSPTNTSTTTPIEAESLPPEADPAI